MIRMRRHSLRASFICAFRGVWRVVLEERNMRLHLCAAIFAASLAKAYHFQPGEWMILLLAIMAVLVTETLNTAIERAVDFTSAAPHPLAKAAKDAAAGAVLIASAFAAIIGWMLFYDKIVR